MSRPRSLVFACLPLLFAGANASADTFFTATLTGSQEVPPVATTASGFATFVLNTAQTALTMSTAFTGLDVTDSQTASPADNLIAGHIHAAANGAPGVNSAVVWGFFGSPFNDNNPNDVMITPLANGVGGTITAKWDAPEGNNTTLTAQLANILAGRSYINLHTTTFQGGEIRGQINAIPEPSSMALVAVGELGLIGYAARRRNTR